VVHTASQSLWKRTAPVASSANSAALHLEKKRAGVAAALRRLLWLACQIAPLPVLAPKQHWCGVYLIKPVRNVAFNFQTLLI
jgi:hypothetical protein